MNLGKLQEIVKDWEAWHAAVDGVTNSCTWFSNYNCTTADFSLSFIFLRNEEAELEFEA